MIDNNVLLAIIDKLDKIDAKRQAQAQAQVNTQQGPQGGRSLPLQNLDNQQMEETHNGWTSYNGESLTHPDGDTFGEWGTSSPPLPRRQ